MCKLHGHIVRWMFGGVLYGILEIVWRGHTHWTMMLLAALVCIPLDLANEHMPWELPLWLQAVLGGLTITAAELAAGLVLNVWLGLGIWDYSGLWGNLWGQICPQFAALWCLLACPVIVAFDWMDYWFCGGDRPRYRLLKKHYERGKDMSSENTAMQIKLCLAAVLGTLTALWGWFGWLVLVWAALMLADWLIGSAVAAKDGNWSSAKMRAGAWHKGGMIVIACVALTADWLIGTLLHNLPVVALPFDYGVLLGPLVIVWYVIGELGSLAEHAITMGAPYPAWLPKILEAGKNAVDKVGDELTDGRDGGGHE